VNNRTFLKAAAVAAGPLVLCAAVARATPITAEKRGTPSATHVVVDGGVGIGQFQDIQVPVNEATGMRADGTPAQDENGSHIGVPMHIGLAVDYRPADLWDWTIVRFDALQMTATSGSSTTQAASYSRLGISTELERQVLLDGLAFSAALRAGARRHPWVVRIPISGLPIMPREIAWFEDALACMAGTGLTEPRKASVIMLLSGYVRNLATTEADIAAAIQASGLSPAEWMSSYPRLLRQLTDPQRFPALTAFIAAGVFDAADGPDDEFIFGLDRILDGIEALIPPGPRPG